MHKILLLTKLLPIYTPNLGMFGFLNCTKYTWGPKQSKHRQQKLKYTSTFILVNCIVSISSLLHQRIDYPIMNQSIIVDVHHQYIVALNECRSCGFLFLLLRRNILLIQFIKTLRNVSFLHGKRISPRIFFLLRQKFFRGRLYPPEGRLYARAKRGR